MFNKIFYFIKRNISRRNCTLKQEKGFSLVEVIIAIVIMSIITLVLVSGTMTAVDVLKINRAKTLSLAVASEKLELIKCMNYEDIEPGVNSDDWKLEHTELGEAGYDINYEITWVDGEDSYKQVEISISKEPMNKPISVISQIYPLKEAEEEIEHPPPLDLNIKDDSGSGLGRSIELEWIAPADTELGIHHYNIYRDDEATPISGSNFLYYIDQWAGDNNVHSYYVTAVYDDGEMSGKSNEVTTEYLRITDYTLGGPNRKVHLAWGEAPDIGLEFVEFVVYKDGEEIERTTDKIYSETIGSDNFTYYVTAIYEGDIESDPSNEVTTE